MAAQDRTTQASPIPIQLALQGGGAHGAFTWGVLDRLLEQPGLVVQSISGTSSGAMNACAVAQGWARGGAEGAREQLEAFWKAVSRSNTIADQWMMAARALNLDGWLAMQASAPLSTNPLRGLVQETFDMELLRRGPVRLHVAATRLRDGALVLFDNDRLSHDALLASACLPQLFPTVQIDGDGYWDGGYAGNPVLEPLLRKGSARDVVCVLLQPLDRQTIPSQPSDIAERAAQLGFAAAFVRELRSLSRARMRPPWSRIPWFTQDNTHRVRLHVISPADELVRSEGNSAMDTRWNQLQSLRAMGRAAADAWAAGGLSALGRSGTFSLED